MLVQDQPLEPFFWVASWSGASGSLLSSGAGFDSQAALKQNPTSLLTWGFLLCTISAMFKFDARIYDRKEHWAFDVVVVADDEKGARQALLEFYPVRDYSIKEVRRVR